MGFCGCNGVADVTDCTKVAGSTCSANNVCTCGGVECLSTQSCVAGMCM
jgi:hypothetical protein